MDKILKNLNYLDWFIATALITYGAVTSSWLWAGAGMFSLVVAFVNPSKRFKAWIEKRTLKSHRDRQTEGEKTAAMKAAEKERQWAASQRESALNSEPRGQGQSSSGNTTQPSGPLTAAYAPRPLQYVVKLHGSRHNLLTGNATNLQVGSHQLFW